LLVENSYDSLVLIGEDATVLYASPSLPRVIGYAVEEFVGRNIFEFVHPEDLDRTRGLFARCLENPETPIRCECRYRHKDDSWRDLEAVGVNRLLDPEIGAVIANFRDVTERRQAESALRDSEERFRAFVETSADWVWACDPAGIMTYSNAAVVNILGYRQEELQNADSFDWLHPEDCAPSRALLDDCVARKIGWRNFTIRWRHRDGTYRDMESTGVPVLDAAGEVVGFRGVDRDITERRRLEGQLRQSQKMEAVGRLAGGVAHDFNNLLTAILGYARLLLGRAEPGPDWRQEIQEIQAAAQRAADLTQQLLAFGRRQVLVLEVLDLGAVVAGMTRMLQRMVGDGVTLQVVAGPEKCCVRAGRAQIEQVLMNLAMNARDAMPAGGTLTVAVREAVLDAAFVRDHPGAQAGTWALLSVRDTGTGIDAATRSHLFEPFFTTKTVGKGTGLGLATVYGIVKQSGGYIAVESRPGEGTEFQVYLPRGAAQVSVDLAAPGVAEPGVPAMTGAKSRTAEAENRPGDPETILVIEDDRAVRLLVREILEAAGYRVLDAPGGQEALRLADEHDGPIHLLLVDVIMPGMSGREVADRMAAVRPGVPTLYMSGYTDDAIVRHGVAVRDVDFIQKPFTPDALARRVRAALDRTAARNAA
jgi:PAS domain S-box-containing protein